jgi:uncharacterized protein (TIGR03083 family)
MSASSSHAREATLGQYREGLAAISDTVGGWDASDWARPACGVWTGTDLAGHLVTVIGWYHDWLDRGLAGRAEPAFPIAELDEQTVTALAALSVGSGPERIATFVASADAYATRLVEHWDAPYAYPRGRVTAGLHAGFAAVEWHVHAWDFAHAVGGEYEPRDAAGLFLAAARCQLAIVGGVRERVGLLAAAAASKRAPWSQLLHRMGRT